MVLKVAAPTTSSLHLSPQPSVPHSPSSSQALASAISSPSSKRHSFDGALFCRYTHKSHLLRSRSCDNPRSPVRTTLRRALTTSSLSSFSDEEFSKQMKELALKFQLSEDEIENRDPHDDAQNSSPFEKFPMRDEIIPVNIERRANSVEIPLSLRIIKRKKQWQKGFKEAGESAVKKAFSSMVFIFQELQSYTLHMREALFYEDLQGILARVQKDMHESFVWLFQQVFSHTPTLMVHVMILLANYSVYSMGSNAIAAPPLQTYVTTTEVVVSDNQKDTSVIRTIKLSSLNGKTSSVGGNNGGGGGGKYKSIASGTDGEGSESNCHLTIVPNSVSSIGNSRNSGEELVSKQEEEVLSWNSIVEEVSRDDVLDQETRLRFISPVDARIEADDHMDYFKTELFYQTGLAQEPNNPLLLANYAQFLYLVAQDFDRAEDYFKKATKVEPKDAEALNKYANFLWLVRNDLWAAEETYLEAIDAEPTNSYYAANYAHFLWNTGGEDTCFPLSSPDSEIDV
ncbi:hypothetical protein ACJIZ3_012488 [Penstemon smallii]|uniref:Uncharacterized protein n=1 Tax=Penstemon smallii TaxID=265156 RepID=A0ABD3UPC1_9LAMI